MDYHPLRSHGFRCLQATEIELGTQTVNITADSFQENRNQPGLSEDERAALRFYKICFQNGSIQVLDELALIQLLGAKAFQTLPDGLNREASSKAGWKY